MAPAEEGCGVSIQIMSRVWSRSKAEGGALLALLAIADFADDEGLAWPSLEVLAKKARLSVRQLCTVLDELEDLRELHRERSTGGRNKRSRYRVTLSENREEISLKKQQRKNNSEICDTKTVKRTSHALNRHRNVNIESARKARTAADHRIRDFFDFWAEEYEKRFAAKYVFTGGKEGQLLKTLLASHDLPALQGYALRFMESPDAWIREKGGYTLGVFASQINKLASTGRLTINGAAKELPL